MSFFWPKVHAHLLSLSTTKAFYEVPHLSCMGGEQGVRTRYHW
jgi:hypothetical protein